MIKNKFGRLLFWLLLPLLLGGCASITSDIEIESRSDPKIKLAGYSTYGWMDSATIINDPCLLYTSPSPRDGLLSRMPSSA